MNIVNDMVGDEDPISLQVEYLKQALQENIYKAPLNLEPYRYEQSVRIMEDQYRKVLFDLTGKLQRFIALELDYNPQVKCTLQEDGKMNISFLCPQWIVDMINEDGDFETVVFIIE